MDIPFFFYSKSFPQFLYNQKITLVFSTYQAGKIILVSSSNGQSIQLYAKNFVRPMGITFAGDKMAVASKSKVDVFARSEELAQGFPVRRNRYETLFIPQLTYYTGMADIHEIEWGADGLWAVNTAFSCLSLMDDRYNFVPKWQPEFISELLPEDRCHLNGMTMKEGRPAYVTVFDRTDEKEGWRNGDSRTGMIIDVANNLTIEKELAMPHSPLYHKDDLLYYLLSATGEIRVYDFKINQSRSLTRLDNFIRGCDIYGDYMVVGASQLRDSSKAFGNIEDNIKGGSSGIYILNRHDGAEVAKLTFTDRINEIFSVKMIPNCQKPAMITTNDDAAQEFISAPGGINYWIRKVKENEQTNSLKN